MYNPIVFCADSDPCTDDSCNPITGQCSYVPSTVQQAQILFPEYQDVGCSTSIDVQGNEPDAFHQAAWNALEGPYCCVNIFRGEQIESAATIDWNLGRRRLAAPAGPTDPFIFEYVISHTTCPDLESRVNFTVKRYDSLAVPDFIPDQYIGCASSTLLTTTAPFDGKGRWGVLSGTGVVQKPNNPTSSLVSMGSPVTDLQWEVYAPQCQSQTSTFTIYRDETGSSNCTDCAVVDLGGGVFVNTCDDGSLPITITGGGHGFIIIFFY